LALARPREIKSDKGEVAKREKVNGVGEKRKIKGAAGETRERG